MRGLFKSTQVGIKRAVGFSVVEESSKSQESRSGKEPGVTLYGTKSLYIYYFAIYGEGSG